MQMPVNVGDREVVGLTPAVRPRGALTYEVRELVEDVLALLRRIYQDVTLSPEELELYRDRWRRVRGLFGLLDPCRGLRDGWSCPSCARGACSVPDPSRRSGGCDGRVRSGNLGLVDARPAEPLRRRCCDQLGARSIPLTRRLRCVYNRWTDDRWNWDGYLALFRCVGLEFGLGRPAAGRGVVVKTTSCVCSS